MDEIDNEVLSDEVQLLKYYESDKFAKVLLNTWPKVEVKGFPKFAVLERVFFSSKITTEERNNIYTVNRFKNITSNLSFQCPLCHISEIPLNTAVNHLNICFPNFKKSLLIISKPRPISQPQNFTAQSIAASSTIPGLEFYYVQKNVVYTKCLLDHTNTTNSKYGLSINKTFRICSINHLFKVEELYQIQKNFNYLFKQNSELDHICSNQCNKKAIFQVDFGVISKEIQTTWYCSFICLINHIQSISSSFSGFQDFINNKIKKKTAEEFDLNTRISKEHKDFTFFTGISKQNFANLILQIRKTTNTPIVYGKKKWSFENIILLGLMHLRFYFVKDLSNFIFNISPSTFDRYLELFFKSMISTFPNFSTPKDIEDHSFLIDNKKTSLVIDCAEQTIIKSTNKEFEDKTYSGKYKENTVSLLLGVSIKTGEIWMKSPSYEGSKTDTSISNNIGYNKILPSDHYILCDKGFSGDRFIRKQNKTKGYNFSQDIINLHNEIDYYRIIVENVIGAIINKYSICGQKLRYKSKEENIIEMHSQVWHVCCCLHNLYGKVRNKQVIAYKLRNIKKKNNKIKNQDSEDEITTNTEIDIKMSDAEISSEDEEDEEKNEERIFSKEYEEILRKPIEVIEYSSIDEMNDDVYDYEMLDFEKKDKIQDKGLKDIDPNLTSGTISIYEQLKADLPSKIEIKEMLEHVITDTNLPVQAALIENTLQKIGVIYDVGAGGDCGPLSIAAGLKILRKRNKTNTYFQNEFDYSHEKIRELVANHEEYGKKPMIHTSKQGVWWQTNCFDIVSDILKIPIILVQHSFDDLTGKILIIGPKYLNRPLQNFIIISHITAHYRVICLDDNFSKYWTYKGYYKNQKKCQASPVLPSLVLKNSKISTKGVPIDLDKEESNEDIEVKKQKKNKNKKTGINRNKPTFNIKENKDFKLQKTIKKKTTRTRRRPRKTPQELTFHNYTNNKNSTK